MHERHQASLLLTLNTDSKGKVVVLLLLFVPGCATAATTPYPPRRFGVVEEVKNIVHEVVLMRILLVLQTCFEGLLENGHHIRTIRCRHEFKRTIDLFTELVPAIDCLLLQVDLVRNDDAGDVLALVPHLSIPVAKVRVCDLAGHIKHHDAYVGPEVVGRMQLVERLLACRVPDIYSHRTNVNSTDPPASLIRTSSLIKWQDQRGQVAEEKNLGEVVDHAPLLTNFVRLVIHRVVVAEHRECVGRRCALLATQANS